MILRGNHYEIINFIYLCMLSVVATKNVAIVANEEVFCIRENVQIGDPNVNKELGLEKNKGKDNAQGLTMSEILPPPPIDNGRFGYV
jgi:hypothetical protein